jgi:hypothetical protein
MILDSKGRPMVRRLGFAGGLEVEKRPKGSSLVSLIGCDRVWPETDEAGIESGDATTQKNA